MWFLWGLGGAVLGGIVGSIVGYVNIVNSVPTDPGAADGFCALLGAIPILLISVVSGFAVSVALYFRKLTRERKGVQPVSRSIRIGRAVNVFVTMLVILIVVVSFNERTGTLGMTMLTYEAQTGDAGAVRILVFLGSKVNVLHNGWTPLMYAADSEDIGCVRALVAAKSNVGVRDRSGETALMIALLGDEPSPACIKCLILAGSDVNAADNNGDTPLTRLAKFGNLSLLQSAVKAGADIDQTDNEGRSAVEYAAQNPSLDCLQFLLSKGGNVNSKDSMETTPLMSAAWAGSLPCLKYLLDHGASVKTKDDAGNDTLALAAESGNIECMNLLISKGLRATPHDYTLAFFAANKAGNLADVKYFVSKGAHVNANDPNGTTALNAAVQANRLDLVEFLLSKGGAASINGLVLNNANDMFENPEIAAVLKKAFGHK
jgi:ankyrin repeat protein